MTISKLPEIGPHILKHGDAVKDVAFTVEDCRGLYKKALKNGAVSVREPWTEEDENGTVIFATIQTVSNIGVVFNLHTLVTRYYSNFTNT